MPCRRHLPFAATALTLVFATLLPEPVSAAEDEGSASHLEEVVVVANRLPLALRRIAPSVTVINEAEISAHGNLGLATVLRQLPSVAVSNAGGPGQTTTLRIRGEEGFRTLTILDGLRLSDPSAPQVTPQLEHLLSSGIQRVEILRGPQGLGYGADAGGVLNISSRSGRAGLQGALDAQTGAFGTQQYSANLGGANGTADFFASATRLRTDGFNALAADRHLADKDGYHNDSLHLRGTVNVVEGWRIDAVHRLVDAETRYDNCFSPTGGGHDCLSLFEQRSSRLALEYSVADYSHSLSYNRTATQRDNYSSAVFAFGATGALERWEYNGSATSLPGFKLIWGADLEQARNNGIGRSNTGAHLEYLSDFSDRLFLTAGLRHDDNEDFGRNTSHRVSAAWLLDMPNDATLKFKSSIGSGFRAPSPYEIQYNGGPWAYQPASLVRLLQETSKGWESGVEFVHGSSLQLEAVYFDQNVDDAITFDLENWSGYLQDLGTSNSRGMELSAHVGLGKRWRVTGNYTWNATERPNGLQRLRRPEQLINAGLSWSGLDWQGLTLNAFLRAARGSVDEVAGAVVALPDFAVLDLGANLRVSPSLQVYGRIENALNADYQEVIGYHTAGRAVYAGFRLSYGSP